MAQFKVKFPCGLEVFFQKGMFDPFHVEGSLNECPIHGKNCPPEKFKTKTKEEVKGGKKKK